MAQGNDKKARKEYLAEVNYWETDKVKSLLRSNKVAWILAIFGLGLAALSSWSVGQLVPLKTVEPIQPSVQTTTRSG